MHLSTLDVEHAWNVRACQVDVENANFVAGPREGKGQLDGDGGFTDAALAGEDLWGVVSGAASSRMTRSENWVVTRITCLTFSSIVWDVARY